MDGDTQANLNLANQIINYSTFSLTIILQVAFFIGKPEIDAPALILLLTYLFVCSARLFFDSSTLYSGSDYLQPLTSIIIWGILLFFVCEMSYVRDTLDSSSVKDLQERRLSWRRRRNLMFFILLGVYFPFNMAQFIQQTLNGISDGWILWVRAISFVLVTAWAFPVFILHFLYFIQIKSNKLLENE
jgi:hypothetical protein